MTTGEQFWAVIAIGLIIFYGAYFLRVLKQKLFNKDGHEDGQPGTHKRVWSVSDKEEPAAHTLQADSDDPLLEEFTSEHNGPEDEYDEERIFHSLELLAEEIEQSFADPGCNATKDLLLARLRERIQAYPLLRAPAFKNALINVISQKSVETGIAVTRAEAYGLWDGSAEP